MLGAAEAKKSFSDIPNADFTGADSHKNLVVNGDAGDTLDLRDGSGATAAYVWSLDVADRNLADTGAGDFDFYNLLRSGVVVASIAVDAEMVVV